MVGGEILKNATEQDFLASLSSSEEIKEKIVQINSLEEDVTRLIMNFEFGHYENSAKLREEVQTKLNELHISLGKLILDQFISYHINQLKKNGHK
jgi:hypothetical protein